MATLILKSLAAEYALVLVFCLFIVGNSNGSMPFWFVFVMPLFFWPAIFIVAALAMLVFLAIREHLHK